MPKNPLAAKCKQQDSVNMHGVCMELKKGFRETAVGTIPDDWKVENLGKVVEFLDGKRKPLKDTERSKMKGSIPYYGASGIIDYVNDYLFDEEIILLSEDGENIVSRNSKLAFKVKGKVWVNNHAHVLKPKSGYDIDYLTEKLESINYKQYNTGTAQPKLNQKVCSGISIAVPPTKAEQTAIATTLSDTDALITSLEKLIAKKRDIKQGAMQELLKPKKGWKLMRVSQIGKIDVDNLNSDRNPEYCFKYITLEDVDHGVLKGYAELKFKNAPSRARRRIQNGDILLSTVRPNLKSHLLIRKEIQDWVCSTGFSVVRCNSLVAYSPFVFNLFFDSTVSNQIERIIGGSNYPSINSSQVKSLELCLPPIDDQIYIASILDDMDEEIQGLENKLEKLWKVKLGMMQTLLTGKIRLNH